MKTNKPFLVLALVAAAAALRATPVAAQAGPEQTATFVKTLQGTVKAIGESRAQLQKTVTTYNSITEMTAKDIKGAYKDLNEDVADSEKKVVDGRPKVDEMNTAAEGYFAAWKESAAAISDADLRKRSEERLADAQARFKNIAAARQGRAAELRHPDDRREGPVHVSGARPQCRRHREPQAQRGQVQHSRQHRLRQGRRRDQAVRRVHHFAEAVANPCFGRSRGFKPASARHEPPVLCEKPVTLGDVNDSQTCRPFRRRTRQGVAERDDSVAREHARRLPT
jgi:hypothetical protein